MAQSAPSLPPSIVLLGEVAGTVLGAWVVFIWFLWLRYRRSDQSPWRILYYGWVLLDRRLFRPDGHQLLLVARITLFGVVLPIIGVFLWLAPR